MTSAYPRLAGTLVPVFALRHENDFGVGDTRAVREAITFHAEHKLGLLQVLPINETGADNSPYNAISSVALDPIYLHMVPEEIPGLLPETLAELFSETTKRELQAGTVQYRRVKMLKLEVLSRAYVEFEAVDLQEGTDEAYEFQAFVERNMSWLPGYTLFRTLLNEYGDNALWQQWAPEHQDLEKAETWLATCADKDELVRYRQFTAYVQWIAWRQWSKVRAWADEKSVKLIGDIPFGVSRYSADVWSERDIFDLDWSGGAPPEPFFTAGEFVRRWGQNWGIPLYNWEKNRAQDFAWWQQRFGCACEVFHSIRIDHVLGFFRIYAFPWEPQRNDEFSPLTLAEAKERCGGREPHFIPRPDQPEDFAELNCADGEALLKMMQLAAGSSSLIAEDLGMTPTYVPKLLLKLGIPGFIIPHFSVDPELREYIRKNDFKETSVTTWGTHDHPPLIAWYHDLTRRWRGPDGHEAWLELQRLMRFLGENEDQPPDVLDEKLHEAMLRTLLEANSCWTIFTISDVFAIDMRFNQPGTATEDNWSIRLDRPLAEYVKDPAIGPKLKFLTAEVEKSGRALGKKAPSS
jgi:4-alpha-glucanotransferase